MPLPGEPSDDQDAAAKKSLSTFQGIAKGGAAAR